MNATADNLKDRSLTAFHVGTFGGHLYGPEHATLESARAKAGKAGFVFQVRESLASGMRHVAPV